MVRSSEVVFAALFSIMWLGRHLNVWHGSGICMVVGGVLLVGLAGVWSEADDAGGGSGSNPSAGEAVRGILLVIGSEAIQAAQVCVEDYVMSAPGLAFSPMAVVGLEGAFGTLLMAAAVMPAVAFLPGPEGVGLHEDSLETFYMLAHSPLLLGMVLLSVATMAAYNVAGMIITLDLGATSRVVIETIRTALVWLANLAIFYGLRPAQGVAARGWGEPWTRWGWLQAAGFAVLVAGTACYARGDLVQARQLRAKARWALLHASLRDLVEAARAEEPLRPPRIAGPARVRTTLQVLVLAALEAEVRRRHLAAAGIGSRDGMEHVERPMRGRWGSYSRYSDLRLALSGGGSHAGPQRPGARAPGSLHPRQAP